MSLNDQFDMGRIPIKPLPYINKDLANKGELIIDYAGDNPSYHIYITDPDNKSRIIDITSILARELYGSSITVDIDGVEDPIPIHDILNFIYKKFLYPDNTNGFDYTIDRAKVTDPNNKVVILKDTNGKYFFPVVRADSVFDQYGNTVQERLDSISRIGFANEYIQAETNNQSIFEITYPFQNYLHGGNYIELRIGTVYVDKSRYQIVDKLDENGNSYGATITFFNDTFEEGRRIDILYIYNETSLINNEYTAISGGQIANGSISSTKLEKTTDTFTIPDGTSLATGKALYSLYTTLSDAISSNSNVIFAVDESESENNITVDITHDAVNELSEKYIMLNVLINNAKNEHATFNLYYAGNSEPKSYNVDIPNGASPGKLVRFLINSNNIRVVGISAMHLTSTRHIYSCRDQDTEIGFSDLSYDNNSFIKIYRNGIRLFKDLDYSINMQTSTITLFTRAEEGEIIVFEAENIEF